jgi:aspartyl-tRNA(Asn)/glutamyl-tRNA(Gln) amidotransferase subunit A
MLASETLYLSVRQLGRLIRKRQISPVELAESYLARSERLAPKYNAYVTLTPDLALRQAHEAEHEIAHGHYRGPLHGIPYAAKDLVAVEGYKTTWGAVPYSQQQFNNNATVIEKLNTTGAVLIGKAAMIELAGGLGYSNGYASLTGPCRNPWNTDYWTCGSSSGSGAIVAAALAPWALGSDTRGSIICPAASCGIAGMRPSFGRVSRYGSMAIAWSMDKLGPMARTADDCGLLLSQLAGHDPKDHDSLPPNEAALRYSVSTSLTAKRLRIGRLTNAWNDLPDPLAQSLNNAIDALKGAGAQVHDVEVPQGPYEEVAELTILMEAAAAFCDLIASGRCAQLQDPLGKINGYASEQFSASDYLQVQRVRAVLQRNIDRLFDDFDVLTTAAQSSPPERLVEKPPDGGSEEDNKIESRAPDGVSSLCGLPAITVPCGFSTERLPYGIQFIGRAGWDHKVLEAAVLFQRLTKWHHERPKTD